MLTYEAMSQGEMMILEPINILIRALNEYIRQHEKTVLKNETRRGQNVFSIAQLIYEPLKCSHLLPTSWPEYNQKNLELKKPGLFPELDVMHISQLTIYQLFNRIEEINSQIGLFLKGLATGFACRSRLRDDMLAAITFSQTSLQKLKQELEANKEVNQKNASKNQKNNETTAFYRLPRDVQNQIFFFADSSQTHILRICKLFNSLTKEKTFGLEEIMKTYDLTHEEIQSFRKPNETNIIFQKRISKVAYLCQQNREFEREILQLEGKQLESDNYKMTDEAIKQDLLLGLKQGEKSLKSTGAHLCSKRNQLSIPADPMFSYFHL